MRRAWLLLSLGAAVALLAGCTGVPSSSAPQTIQPVNFGAQPTEQSIKPPKNADPREIVVDFLQANAIEPGKHTSARAFLTDAARSRWSDDTATIISDPSTGTYDSKAQTVTVVGRPFGTLDKNGIFSPNVSGDTSVDVSFKVVLDDGQYRIDQLRPGLLLSADQFTQRYTPHMLYFFDNEQRFLVEDPRYTDIIDRSQLAKWLLDRLVAGPRPDLQNAVSSDTMPAQADPTRMDVNVDALTKVEIPGSSQLDSGARDRLAAQLSHTLEDTASNGEFTITDGGRPVTIPSVNGSEFSAEEFSAFLGRSAPAPEVYYLAEGRVLTAAGKPMSGPLGRGSGYYLQSVAMSRPDPTGPLLVAAVQGIGPSAQLWVGNQVNGLKPTGIRGVTTRPSFDSGHREVWVGVGSRLVRVTLSPSGSKTGSYSVPVAQPPAATLRAVRMSPDGARLAVVVDRPQHDAPALLIGSIVRGTGPVRVDSLIPISPLNATIVDVAWLNSVRLFAIGSTPGSRDSLSFDTGVDGTDWTPRPVGLSSPPDSVTVTNGAIAWLSAGGFVWEQNAAGQWVSPTGGQTPGTAPIYLE